MSALEGKRRPEGRGRLVDAGIALALFAGYLTLLLATAENLGYARDEGFYFQAADVYGRWFERLLRSPGEALRRQAVDAAFQVNREHPVLVKSLFALSNLFLQKRLDLFSMEGTSYRFPAMCLASLGVALVFVWGRQASGRLAGLAAALFLASMPRFFYHAHLACFDAPVVTMFLLVAYAYWRAVATGRRRWIALTGLAFGLCLDTKHNAWFLPFLCGGHVAWLGLRALAERRAPSGRGLGGPEFRRGALALAAMLTLGPLVLYALWPWIWHDTLARLGEYARFHLGHEYYNMEFLGANYHEPPMPLGYAPLMTAATVPAVTLGLAAFGALLAARRRLPGALGTLAGLARSRGRDGGEGGFSGARGREASRAAPARASWDPGATELLWAAAIAVSYGAWLSPDTPIFGGTKHWMTAYPFLCLFAGAGLAAGLRRARLFLGARSRWGSRAFAGAFMAAVLSSPALQTARSHPFALSAYTPLVGGAAGAATLGLNRTFWGYTTGSVVDYLNREAPPGARVYVHDTAWSAWEMLRKDGRIRPDLRRVDSVAESDFGLYHHEKHMLGQEYQNWIAHGTVAPAHVAGLDGVPVILVYRRASQRTSGPR